MRTFILAVSIILLCGFQASGQYYTNRNKVWVFADSAGLDFTGGAPVAISSHIDAYEASAAVCDTAGHLLFYSDGRKVYDRTGSLMPSGAAVVPFKTASASQGALIVPVPGDTSKYYLFSLQNIEDTNGYKCRMAYSVIDMSLNGGNGDVVAATMGTVLRDSMGENMISIKAPGQAIWVVTHRKDTALFAAYKITATGIGAPVLSAVGHFNGVNKYQVAPLRASPDGTKIAQGNLQNYMELYDFNASTGVVSNSRIIDSANLPTYGVEFSPDNTKLYVNRGAAGKVVQYDVSLPTPAAIKSSAVVVADTVSITHLRLGPDGRIYFRGNTPDYLYCISKPNFSGAACGLISRAIALQPGTHAMICLPALVVSTDTVVKAGTQNMAIADYKLYPNPAGQLLTVTGNMPIETIDIMDVYGQVVYTGRTRAQVVAIDVSAFAPGIYFARINANVVRVFVKE